MKLFQTVILLIFIPYNIKLYTNLVSKPQMDHTHVNFNVKNAVNHSIQNQMVVTQGTPPKLKALQLQNLAEKSCKEYLH